MLSMCRYITIILKTVIFRELFGATTIQDLKNDLFRNSKIFVKRRTFPEKVAGYQNPFQKLLQVIIMQLFVY